MYPFHRNQFKLSIIIKFSFKYLSLNQKHVHLTIRTLKYIRLSLEEDKQNLNKLRTKLTQKKFK